MIRNKKDYFFYKEADRIISGREKKTLSSRLKLLLAPDPIGKFMRLLRTVEYYENCGSGLLDKLIGKYYRSRFNRISLKLGFSIPANVFGPGLLIPHYGTIVINAKVRVGANCVVHTCVCLTAKEGIKMGDNVYLSTGVIVAGNVDINDNITVSGNSFVNKSFTEKNLLIGGSPAKVLRERKAWFLEDGIQYEQRVNEINQLKTKLYQ